MNIFTILSGNDKIEILSLQAACYEIFSPFFNTKFFQLLNSFFFYLIMRNHFFFIRLTWKLYFIISSPLSYTWNFILFCFFEYYFFHFLYLLRDKKENTSVSVRIHLRTKKYIFLCKRVERANEWKHNQR